MARGLFVVVAVIAACASARAADLREQAKHHYEVGRAAYEAGRWSDALDEFKRAYAIVPIPDLIYNIGHCEERLGRFADAASSYRLFLATRPDAQERKDLERQIQELEKMASAPPRPPPIDLAVRAPPPQVVPPPIAPPAKRPIYRRWWLWTAVGAAALAIGLGVGLGVGLSQNGGPPALGFPAVTVR